MEHALVTAGHDLRVIEDCLNGRRSVWDDQHERLGLAIADVVGPILRRVSFGTEQGIQ